MTPDWPQLTAGVLVIGEASAPPTWRRREPEPTTAASRGGRWPAGRAEPLSGHGRGGRAPLPLARPCPPGVWPGHLGARQSPVTGGGWADSDRAACRRAPPGPDGPNPNAAARNARTRRPPSGGAGPRRDKCSTRATRAASSMTGDICGQQPAQHWKGNPDDARASRHRQPRARRHPLDRTARPHGHGTGEHRDAHNEERENERANG